MSMTIKIKNNKILFHSKYEKILILILPLLLLFFLIAFFCMKQVDYMGYFSFFIVLILCMYFFIRYFIFFDYIEINKSNLLFKKGFDKYNFSRSDSKLIALEISKDRYFIFISNKYNSILLNQGFYLPLNWAGIVLLEEYVKNKKIPVFHFTGNQLKDISDFTNISLDLRELNIRSNKKT